jgi:hypothetical protein
LIGDINMTETRTLFYIPEKRDEWPVPLIVRIQIEDEVGQFLRTHRNGHAALTQALDSIVPDRTLEEFAAECAEQRARHDTYLQKILDETNEHRARRGLPSITRENLK